MKVKAVHHHAELGAGVLVHPILLHTSQKRSPLQASRLLYVWGTQRLKMCHKEFEYFSAYKTHVIHTKLAFLLMLRSICTQGKDKLTGSSACQSCIGLWRIDCSPMHQMITLCRGPLPTEENQSAVCPFWHKRQGDTAKSHVLDIVTPAQWGEQEEKCVWLVL